MGSAKCPLFRRRTDNVHEKSVGVAKARVEEKRAELFELHKLIKL